MSKPEISVTGMNQRNLIRNRADIRALEAATSDCYLPVASTWEMLKRGKEMYGDRPAIRFLEDGVIGTGVREFTHAELFSRVTQAANLFADLGVGPEDAVAMLAPNMPEAHVAMWGAEAAGRICPLNNLLNTDHLVELVQAAGAKVLVALGPDPDLDIWAKAKEIKSRVPSLQCVLCIGGNHDGAADFMEAISGYPHDYLTSGREIAGSDIAACFHTGGTTGAPKLAQHTHTSELHTSWSACLMYDVRPDDVIINGFPLFHVAGSFVYGSAVLMGGGCLLLPTRLGMRHPEIMANYWRHVEQNGVSILAAVPTIMATLLNHPVGDCDISRVRCLITGGSPLPTELANAFEAEFDIPVRNVLGMTESSGLVSIEPFHAPSRIAGSCGLPMPHTEVIAATVASDGVDVSSPKGPGETGVIALRGPHVSPGYTDRKRNAGTFADEGWLISGDLGHVDDNGYVFVTGRSKDVIIRGAHNIDPAMIEEAIDQHPAVAMSAAVGQPDSYAGEVPVLYVTLKPGSDLTEEELLTFVTPLIAERPAVPKRIHVVADMPQTAIGKIYKPTLRLQSIERVFSDALSGLVPSGVTVTVVGLDSGGVLSAQVTLKGPNTEQAVAEAERLLRDFPVAHTIQPAGL